jgi:hypothetical protein
MPAWGGPKPWGVSKISVGRNREATDLTEKILGRRIVPKLLETVEKLGYAAEFFCL